MADQADDDEGYTPSPNINFERSWIDPGELVKVKSYDPTTKSYEVVKVEDPTYVRIFTSPENLAAAVHFLNLEILKQKPTAIIGHDYVTERELVLLEDSDLAKRK